MMWVRLVATTKAKIAALPSRPPQIALFGKFQSTMSLHFATLLTYLSYFDIFMTYFQGVHHDKGREKAYNGLVSH